ncbi:MAG: FAD-dependent oxidoreductase [Ruminococcaceae bacterium]|nr:FAD-dependent oxidoreductase [Oscillospiraceae bacterium]
MDYTSLPLFAEADIVICGGGTAGAFAAKAAADSGFRVLIVEQLGSLGGSATNGLVLPIMSTHMPGNPQCSYISGLVRDKLLSLGGVDQGGMNFDPLLLKIVLEQLCTEAGVRIMFYTTLADTIRQDNRIHELVVVNKAGLGRIRGRCFIDATGDGDLAVRAGASFTKGDPETGKNQAVSLRYIVSGIDMEVFGAFVQEIAKLKNGRGAYYTNDRIAVACCADDSWAFSDLFCEAIANGDLLEEDKVYWQGFTVTGRKGCIAFNNPEFFHKTDGTDPDHLTEIQLLGKQTILRQMRFYRKYLPGFAQAYVSEIASMVGVRESRNILTEYVLSAEDLLLRHKFPDSICRSNYPMDVHGKTLQFHLKKEPAANDGKPWYEIPYRSLVVKGLDNLLVAGRCLGAEFLAQSSLRVQHSARASGEAAGIGAALSLSQAVLPREVDGSEIRAIMLSRGAVFGEE